MGMLVPPCEASRAGPGTPIYRLRKGRFRRMKSLPWGHQAGMCGKAEQGGEGTFERLSRQPSLRRNERRG